MNKYLGRITSEHRVRPKFMSWLAALIEPVEDTIELYRSFGQEFNLETARGRQLDMLGEVVGVGRLLDFEPVYASPLLSDEYYRMILKAKISLNHWVGTTEGIQKLWSGIFNGYTLEVLDWQDMTMTLRVINVNSLFESEFISRGYLAPKPESVRVNYEFVLTRTLSTELFIGGKIVSFARSFELSTPTAVFKMEEGKLYAGGRLSFHKVFDLKQTVERRSSIG